MYCNEAEEEVVSSYVLCCSYAFTVCLRTPSKPVSNSGTSHNSRIGNNGIAAALSPLHKNYNGYKLLMNSVSSCSEDEKGQSGMFRQKQLNLFTRFKVSLPKDSLTKIFYLIYSIHYPLFCLTLHLLSIDIPPFRTKFVVSA